MELSDLLLVPAALPREAVCSPEIPATDGQLYVRRLTGLEREAHADDLGKHAARTMAVHAAWCLCDAAGKPLYVRENDKTQRPEVLQGAIERLAGQPCTLLERIGEAAVRLNAMTTYWRDELKKSSAAAAASASTCDCAAPSACPAAS